MIKHIVMMRLREGIDHDYHIAELKRQLEELSAKIDQIIKLEVGINTINSPRASDLVLSSEFASWEDLNTYRDHPTHQIVVKYVQEIVDEVRVVDYQL
ncbi:MAG: Dabb family protein [Candidatus Marinimicrobia bacterium]|nr:Dabb family protein [Candidatus Neomarinimicrobiota bacterium]